MSTPRVLKSTPDFGAVSMQFASTPAPMSDYPSPVRNSFESRAMTPQSGSPPPGPGLGGVPNYPMTPAAYPHSHSPVPPLNFSQCAGTEPQRQAPGRSPEDNDADSLSETIFAHRFQDHEETGLDVVDLVMTTTMKTMTTKMTKVEVQDALCIVTCATVRSTCRNPSQ
eukprot:293426-Amphidinium_carterae.1